MSPILSAPDKSPHLFVAITPHGYGHAAMTAPVLNELRRRLPDLTMTIQTDLPRAFLSSRIDGDFALVESAGDCGPAMISANEVAVEATGRAYAAFHADLRAVIEREAGRIAALAPDLVLSNISYVACAAAARAGIPSVALSSLNWADIYRTYCHARPEAPRLLAQMEEAYNKAEFFLRPAPAMPMAWLRNSREIGPIIRMGQACRAEIIRRLKLAPTVRLGLISFGGMKMGLPLDRWSPPPGWHWLTSMEIDGRPDMTALDEVDLPFTDMLASCEVVITKPGYGTFTEAAAHGVAVLYLKRPDWPESPFLEGWLARHARCLEVAGEDLLDGRLAATLDRLLTLPQPPRPSPDGVADAADRLMPFLAGTAAERIRGGGNFS